jgi:nucleoside-diphosphate-sugar epimerase
VSPEKPRVAVTGATGFIGTSVVHRLREQGFRVRALRRSSTPPPPPPDPDLEWVSGDLADAGALGRLVEGVAAVVHCAGAVRGSTQAEFDRTNAQGVAALARACRGQDPVPRFLLLSSLAAREPSLSPYARSKRRGEETLAREAGPIPWAALRPPAVYGPGDRELLPLFRWMARGVAPVLGASDARFSLLFVGDLADAVAAWVVRGTGDGTTFELHDGRPGGYGWQDLLGAVETVCGRRVRPVRVPGGVLMAAAHVGSTFSRALGRAPIFTPGKVRELTHPDWVCDNRDFTDATGWEPKVLLEEGLRRTPGWRSSPSRR